MPATIVCPKCRRPQVPREECGRLTCPDCETTLPSGLHGSGSSAESGDPSILNVGAGPARVGAAEAERVDHAPPERAPERGEEPAGRMDGGPLLPSRQGGRGQGPVPGEPGRAGAGRGAGRPEIVDEVNPDRFPDLRGRTLPTGPADRPIGRKCSVRPRRGGPERPRGESLGPGPDRRHPRRSSTVAAISSVALLQGRGPWANGLFLVTVFLLGVSVLGILHRRQARRAFWQGFALFGWGYLTMAFVPWAPHPTGLELPTSQLLAAIHAKVAGPAEDSRACPRRRPPRPGAAAAAPGGEGRGSPGPAPGRPPRCSSPGTSSSSSWWGTACSRLLAALLGSGIAGWFYRSNPGPA